MVDHERRGYERGRQLRRRMGAVRRQHVLLRIGFARTGRLPSRVACDGQVRGDPNWPSGRAASKRARRPLPRTLARYEAALHRLDEDLRGAPLNDQVIGGASAGASACEGTADPSGVGGLRRVLENGTARAALPAQATLISGCEGDPQGGQCKPALCRTREPESSLSLVTVDKGFPLPKPSLRSQESSH